MVHAATCRRILTRCPPCSISNGTAIRDSCPEAVPRRPRAREDQDHARRRWRRHTGKRPIIYTDITFHREVLKANSAATILLDAQRRRRAAGALYGPPLDVLAVHHHGLRAGHRGRWIATSSTARPAIGVRSCRRGRLSKRCAHRLGRRLSARVRLPSLSRKMTRPTPSEANPSLGVNRSQSTRHATRPDNASATTRENGKR